MAITYRTTGVYDSAGSTTAVVLKPTGTVDGDLIFVVIRRAAVVAPSGVPTGWVLVQSVLSTYGWWLYYKVASGEGASWTWTWAASAKTLGRSHSFYGNIDTTTPIQNSTTPYSDTASGTTITIPTLTTSANNTLSVLFASGYSTKALTFAVPTSPAYTEHNDTGHTDPDFWQAIASYNYPTSGTVTGAIVYPASSSTYRTGCQVLVNSVVVAPTVTTQAVTDATDTTATGNGNITDNGGATITEKGVCYMTGTSGDPTTANSKFYDNTNSTGAFTEAMTGLSTSTDYRVRAYAINSAGTGYGLTVQLTTNAPPPLTIALNTPTDTATISDTTPTLVFTGTSLNAFDLEYNIQIDTTNSFGSQFLTAANFTKTLATGEDYTYSITSDANYVYVGTYTSPAKVVRINKSDFTTTVTKTLAAGEDYAYAITNDADYVYVGTANIPAKVVRINKSDFTTTVTKTLAAGEDYAYAITNDADYVYVGTYNTLGKVVRINKSDFTTTITKTMAAGENGAYAITNDTNYVYVGTNTIPAKVVRINKSDFTTTVTKTLATGENYTYAITNDTNYVYVGLNIAPGKVVRINKSDFTTTVTKTLATGENGAFAITNDTDYVYVGTGTAPAKVVRINKSDFTTTVTKTLATGEDYTYAITSDTNYVYVGTGTTPGKVVRISMGSLFSKFSATDTGFVDVTNGADTHPFASGDTISYTVQPDDILAPGTYYWRAAAIEPSGTNVYGDWATPYSFTVYISPPTVALNTPTDTATISDTTPTLVFTGTSLNAFDLGYNIQVDTTNSFGSQFLTAANFTKTLAAGENSAYAITSDTNYVYVGTNTAPGKVVRINKSDFTTTVTKTLATGENSAYAITSDTNYVYVGTNTSPAKVVRINKSDFTTTVTKTLATGENGAFSIASDTNYVYVGTGTNTAPGKVVRINKSDFTTTVTKTLAAGEDYANAITNDATYIYVGTANIPGKVVRINKSDFTTTITKTLAAGEDSVYAITNDTNYIYVGTVTSPGKVVRINKSDFTTTVTKTLAAGEDSVYSITNDTDYVYVGTANIPAKVVRINKSDFTTTVTKTLAAGEDGTYAITSDTNYVYVGTATSPAKVVRINIGSPLLFSKFSATDTGFVDVTNGADTHPFASGDEISYTVQPDDILAPGTYYWRAAAIEPSGSNTYGAYSSTQSFSLLYLTLANGQYKADLSAIAIGGAAGTAGYTTKLYQEQLLSINDPNLALVQKVENKQVGTSFSNTATTTGTSMYIGSNDLPTPRSGVVMGYDSLNKRYIHCGGSDGTNRFTDLWAVSYYVDNIHPRYRKLSPTGTPPAAKNLGAAVQLNKNNKSWFVYFGGATPTDNQAMNIADCTTPGSESWTSVTQTNTPAARSYITHHMVEVSTGVNTYDVYLFGGWGTPNRVNDLMKCSFDLSSAVPTSITWTTVKANGAGGNPPTLSGGVMIYDSTNNRLVLYGGNTGSVYSTDLWSFNIATTTWSQLSPSGTIPTGRELHCGAFDVTNQRMVVFTGWRGGDVTTCRNDIVSIGLTLGSESYLTIRANDIIDRGFSPFYSGTACLDTDRRLIVEFGQINYDSQRTKLFYVFDLNEGLTSDSTMYSLNIADHFMARDAAAYCVDTTRNMGVFAFGFSNMVDDATQLYGDHTNEVWAYDYSGNSLRYVNAGVLGSGAREGAMACYDSVNDRIITFGGLISSNSLSNETWELKPDAFGNYKARRMLPIGTLPDSRWLGVIAFDATRNRVVVWGGKGVDSTLLPNTSMYILDLSGGGDGVWSLASPTGTKPAEVWQPMYAYKESNHCLYIYSGCTTDEATNQFSSSTDYIDLTNATPAWVHLSATNTVAVRGGVMVLDTTNNYLIAFGGATSATAELNTVSFLNLASGSNNWFTVSPTGTLPTARRSASGWFLNGKFYVTSGRPGIGTWFSDLHEFTPNYATPSSSSWSNKSPSIYCPISTATTGLTNNTNYHWQSWVTVAGTDAFYSSFGGGNLESATDFTIGVVAGSTGIKVWNGTSWAHKPVKVWAGGQWVEKPVKVWNGSSWITKG